MWSLNNLTKPEIIHILKLLHDPKLQQDIYINPNHPYRIYMPFLDQPFLQEQFFAWYGQVISTIDPNLYKLRLYF